FPARRSLCAPADCVLLLRWEFEMNLKAFLRSFFGSRRSSTSARAKRHSGFKPMVEMLEDRLVLSTFTVNTTHDELTAGDGKLSLREAITKANNHAGADTIVLPSGVFKMELGG